MTPRTGINWSKITPTELRPQKVTKAVAEVERLQELEQAERKALIDAAAALEQAEAADVTALAQSFRSGAEAKPQTTAIEKARADVREHERRVSAAGQALAAAEADLGSELQRSREPWRSAVATATDETNAHCRQQLDALQSGLQRLALLRGLGFWLDDGMDDAKPARTRGLLASPSSARSQANSAPVDGNTLLQWIAELVDVPQREPVVHAPQHEVASI